MTDRDVSLWGWGDGKQNQGEMISFENEKEWDRERNYNFLESITWKVFLLESRMSYKYIKTTVCKNKTYLS